LVFRCDRDECADTVESDRRANLFELLPDDHGAHGKFDGRAHAFSTQMCISKNPKLLALARLAFIGALIGAFRQRRRNLKAPITPTACKSGAS